MDLDEMTLFVEGAGGMLAIPMPVAATQARAREDMAQAIRAAGLAIAATGDPAAARLVLSMTDGGREVAKWGSGRAVQVTAELLRDALITFESKLQKEQEVPDYPPTDLIV